MTLPRSWIRDQLGGAPADLRQRVLDYAELIAPGRSLSGVLAEASDVALAETLDRFSDRSIALDLLAADALITLALLARAEETPEQLGEFAARLMVAYASRA